jgi:cell filamentation protein
MSDAPYTYPGTSLLRNLAGLRDPKELEVFEASVSFRRLLELQMRPLRGGFDSARLKEIHHYIFQDVYAWAGQFRSVNISKPEGVWFARPEYIEASLRRIFEELAAEQGLRGLGKKRFVVKSAYYLGEINAVHAFREGNGRAQREFVRELAQAAGYAIDWMGVTREEMRAASIRSFQQADNSELEDILLRATTPLDSPRP